jgi:tetratricopeptide (TPR) repeat protein
VDGADGCRPWLYRIASWYLKESVPRDVALGRRWRVGLAFEEYAASNSQLPSRADALTWWRAEWASVVDCVELAHRNGLHDIAWQLCVALFKYLHMNGHYDPWLRTHDLGVESAKAAGDDSGLMQAHNQRGAVRLALGDLDAARGDFGRSHELALQVGHLAGEQSALEWLGKIAARAGDVPMAMDYYRQSQEVVERAGAALGDEQPARMVALLDLQRGRAWIEEASWDQATAAAERAEAYFASVGESENQAKSLLVLGDAAMGRGDVDGAVERFERAVALFDRDGALRSSANARRSLGKALVVADRKADAIAVYLQAQETFDRLFDDAADELARMVAELRA